MREAYRVCAPGGVFYAFEPFDRGVLFEPRRPALEKLIRWWDEQAESSGLDPLMGPKVAAGLIEAGFSRVRTKSFPVLALAEERDRYLAICDNLRKFYFADSPCNPIMRYDAGERSRALKELFTMETGALVMDQFFVTWGYKDPITERRDSPGLCVYKRSNEGG